MCPACLSSLASIITGGISVLGGTVAGAALVRDGKIGTTISKIWKMQEKNQNRREDMEKKAEQMQHEQGCLGMKTPPVVRRRLGRLRASNC